MPFSENFFWVFLRNSCELHNLPFGFFGFLATSQESSWHVNRSLEHLETAKQTSDCAFLKALSLTDTHFMPDGSRRAVQTRFAQRRLLHAVFTSAPILSNRSPLHHPLRVRPFLASSLKTSRNLTTGGCWSLTFCCCIQPQRSLPGAGASKSNAVGFNHVESLNGWAVLIYVANCQDVSGPLFDSVLHGWYMIIHQVIDSSTAI